MSAKNFVDVLRSHAEKQPHQAAYYFLEEGDIDGAISTISYAELEQRAGSIAATLQEKKSSQERALLLYPPGLDFAAAFFGCLFGGVIAVPVYPPNPTRVQQTLPTLRAIAKDSGARFVLTTKAIKELALSFFSEAPELASLHWIATDELTKEARPLPSISESDIAFLQYTSGSTGDPKGVIITHQNLMVNSAEIYRLAQHGPESVYVCWLPAYHDMGLIGGILQPVYGGFPGVLLSPQAFLQKPLRWLQAISHFKGTTSPFPNFALDLCVRKISDEEVASLDLRSWRLACNGAEPIRDETLRRFSQKFSQAGFGGDAHYPAYGLAEATLIVTGGDLGEPLQKTVRDKKTLIGCGRALQNHRVVIVDPMAQTRLQEGEVGEIWLQGPSIAKGYWSRPEETQEVFGARLSNEDSEPFLRTGDLGFLWGGALYITGRIKDVIILHGKNYYPQDLESSIEQSGVRPGCSAAFSIEANDEERLVIVAEVKENIEPQEVIRRIQKKLLEDHQLSAHCIALLPQGAIPKTSSGKLKRYACKEGFLYQSLEVLYHWEVFDEVESPTENLEAWLCQVIARRLGITAASLKREQQLSSLGLDSLKALEVAEELSKGLGRDISAVVLHDHPTINALVRYLKGDTNPLSKAPQKRESKTKISFLFAKEGEPLLGVGRELFETQIAFRGALSRCDNILQSFCERSLLSLLYPEPEKQEDSKTLLSQPNYSQPVLLALEYSLFEMWRSLGVAPDVVVGSGIGEIAAACAAGFVSLEHALEFAAERGRLMSALSIEECLPELDLLVAGLDFKEGSIPMVSTVTGERFTEEVALTLLHWRRHIRGQERSIDAMRTLRQLGCEVFIELGPF